LNKFTIHEFIFDPATLKIFNPIALQLPQCAFKHFSMAQLAIFSPPMTAGSKLIPMTEGCQLSFPLLKIQGLISQRSLQASKLNANYRQALRQPNIKLVNGILYYHTPIVRSESCA
jgi:hypothetical protein